MQGMSDTVVHASIAQMVERKTLNLVVVGSIPTGGALFFLPQTQMYSICIHVESKLIRSLLSSDGRALAF